MSKLAWVLLPLLLAGAWLAWSAWRGRLPPRPVINVWFSLLLLVYLGTTAGLGIFWVANQHLPVFDWHYLFGYATVLLLAVHLAFNLRIVWRHLRRRVGSADAVAAATTGRRPLLAALGFGAALGGAYLLGLRHGRTEWRIDAGAASAEPARAGVIDRFHEFSAHSRSGVFRRAPGADWGDAPPPFKDDPGGEPMPLPAPGAARAGAGLDVAALGSLLWHAAAVNLVRGAIHFRTAPSSGALFATELYVAAIDVPGLPSGLWHYRPRRHALQRLGDMPSDPWALGTPVRARARLIATAVFRRSGHKYRDRCYRYVLADLGHALENLRASAAALGVPARFATAFDESLAAATLGLDEAEEGVLALVDLAPGGASAADASRAWRAAPLPVDAPLGVTQVIHRATSLRAGPIGGDAPAAAPAPSPIAGDTGAWVPLPPPRAHRIGALDAIARRRSIRRYADAAIAQDALSALLDAALRRHAPLYSSAVRVDVLTPAVQGLPAAAWRYGARPHGLLRQREQTDLRGRARRAALDQAVVGDAALVVVLSIDREALAADPLGAARGYRHAFLEAGLVGERLYLEGVALGLGVCGVGAFYDDEAAALIGVDPPREWVVHFIAVGVPA